MKIDVYCDESYPDLFSSKEPRARYLFIGSLWLPRNRRNQFKDEIHKLRDQHKIGGEFKWTKISPSKREFYEDLLNWFISKGDSLRFRCIAVDNQQVNLIRFHQNDQELGFYKFYYQMLQHWIHPFNQYKIFCDLKCNRLQNRLHTLHRCLDCTNLSTEIQTVQSIRSRESVLIQLSDVLVGLTASRMNKRLKDGSAKAGIANSLERLLGKKIRSTAMSEKKFNVFKINLSGGW